MTGSASEKVRKHRAPKGALRRYRGRFLLPLYPMVRKHRAPKGALRLAFFLASFSTLYESESTERQKVH